MNEQRYRVAQWGTGHTGMRSLRDVLDHPRLDLVGVCVYSDAKVGRDAGDLAGTETTGVTATRDLDEIIATRPDCVLYMPLLDHHSIDDLCRLLEAGVNVVTTITEFHHAPSIDAHVRARLEDACVEGGASLYDTGGAPGFISEIFPLAVLMMERRLDRLSITQFADLSQRKSPEMLAKLFGGDPAAADLADHAERLRNNDGAGLRQTADAIGLPLDDLVTSQAVAVTTKTVQLGVMTIEAGSVGAWRLNVTGKRQGKPLLDYSRTMYVAKDLDPAWELRDTGWHVVVAGDAPLDIEIRFPVPEEYHPISAGYNSHTPVNAVPAVCDAPPGILTTADLRLVPYFA